MRIAFVGNFTVPWTTENHHKTSLESLGHTVVPLQEHTTPMAQVLAEGLESDMLVWVRTDGVPFLETLQPAHVLGALKDAGIPTVSYHLDLWIGLDRQVNLETDPYYRNIGHFFTADRQMADWFNENTDVRGHYLQAGVFGGGCYIAPPNEERHETLFVGSDNYHSEWPYRPQLVNWMHRTYGAAFAHYGGTSSRGGVREHPLNQVYASSKVVIGDSCCIGFDYPEYWSDRVYETIGRGGFIIHPYIKGMEEHFEDGKHLVFYRFGDFAELKDKIDYYLSHDVEREEIRLAGHNHVKHNHTYEHRWDSALKTLQAEGAIK